MPVAFSTKALYWNKDLFAAAGLDPEKAPATWEEEIAAAKTIKEKTGTAGFGVVAKTSTTPCTSSCTGFTPTTAR